MEQLGQLARARSAFYAQPEQVSLEESSGRILAADLVSPENLPRFHNSAMDGFAVVAASTAEATSQNPLILKVSGCTAAGDAPAQQMAAGQVVEIMTGAPMPANGADAVVKIEDVGVTRDTVGRATEITLSRPANCGDNVRLAGSDFSKGQAVASRGIKVRPEEIMALASLGIAQVVVYRRPRVAVISTGRELVPFNTPEIHGGQIRNSTAPFLVSALPFHGVEARFCGTVQDDPAQFETLIETVLDDPPDLILTTGAVSMGQFDFIAESLSHLGAKIHFHKVALRPGKPLLCAEFPGDSRPGPVLLGLPGNPIASAVGLRFFVQPFLRGLLNRLPEIPTRARLENAVFKKPEGLRCFFKAQLKTTEDGAFVTLLKKQDSFVVSSLLEANAWAVLPESGAEIKQGEILDVHPLQPA